MIRAHHFFARYLGIDRALFYSLLSRSWQMLSGIVVLFLVVHFMDPITQGFYYTFKSILNLQLFFEMGLSFVILQSTSHYFVNLAWGKQGTITGDELSREKLVAFIHKGFIWYSAATALFILILIPAGFVFFNLKKNIATHISWITPWIFVVIGTGVNLLLSPFLAVIEGSGRVAQINKFRTVQFFLATAASWIVLALHGALWTPVANIWVTTLVALVWLPKTYKEFIRLIWRTKFKTNIFGWSSEIWPLQWRIALSWVSGFFIMQFFTPLLFYYSGPVVSGQMGISITLTSMLSLLCLSWVSVRSPQMGSLAAEKNWFDLDQLFKRIFAQSVFVFLSGTFIILALLYFFNAYNFSHRWLPWFQISLLFLGMFSSHVVGALALYLRAHKAEPFMPLSVIGAVLITLSSWLGAKYYGSYGVCVAIAGVNIIYGLPSGLWLWLRYKRKWHGILA